MYRFRTNYIAEIISSLETTNQILTEMGNQGQNASATLTMVTGQNYGMNQDDWQEWWANEQGYVYERPPVTQVVATRARSNRSGPRCHLAVHFSCASPPERRCERLTGPERSNRSRSAIAVLAQDAKDGRLSYQPVLAIHHNKPSATLKIELKIRANESVVATGIHRFWKSGHGWVMARDLKAGDVLRTIGGTARVGSVESESVQPVFNLEVGPSQSYLVGNGGVLVHDNSIVQPVTRPFDAEPTLASRTFGQ